MAFHFVMPRALDVADSLRQSSTKAAPRHSIAMLASELGATIHSPAHQSTGIGDYLRSRVLPSREEWAFASSLRLRSAIVGDDDIFCTSEHPGLHVASVFGARRDSPRVTVFVHNVNRPRARAAIRIWRLAKTMTRFIACSQAQVDFLRNEVGIADERACFVFDHTDTSFFCPGPPALKNRPKIASVGLEQRDYRTLALASEALDVDVCISGFSRDTPESRKAFPDELPKNMSRKFYKWPELSQLYRDADVVVVSAFENNYAAGVQALMEGMASGRPVVVTATKGLAPYLDPAAVVAIPPGNAMAMREAIQYFLDHPTQATEMGRRGRELACIRHSIEGYVAALKELLTHTGHGQ